MHLLQLLPNRVDWTGKEHPRTYQNLVSGAKVFYDLIFPHTELKLNFPHFCALATVYSACNSDDGAQSWSELASSLLLAPRKLCPELGLFGGFIKSFLAREMRFGGAANKKDVMDVVQG